MRSLTRSTLLLLALGLLVLLAGSFQLPLMDRDEPRFVQATREMQERNDWIIPTFNGAYRFDKPPLTYWWMGLHFKLFGDNEMSARLHSVISALIIAVVILFWGNHAFGERRGFMAAVAWLTCFQVLIHGRMAVADMPMIAFLVLAQWLTWRQIESQQPLRLRDAAFWGLYASLGLAFLAKGPLPIAVWALTLVFYRWGFARRTARLTGLALPAGIAVMLTIIGAWGIPALVLTGGAFWDVGMGTHVVARGTSAFNDRWALPLYYFLTAGVSLFPWVFLLPERWNQWRSGCTALEKFLFAWAVAPLLIFSLYATQLPHYILPAFPALFLALFARAEAAGTTQAGPAWLTLLCRLYACVWIAVGLGLAVGLIASLWQASLLFSLLFGGGLLNLAGCMGLYRAYRDNHLGRMGPLLALLAVGLCSLGYSAGELAVTKRLAAALIDSEAEVRISYRFGEPGLVYYTGLQWNFPRNPEALQTALDAIDGTPAVVLVRTHEVPVEKEILRWFGRKSPPPAPVSQIAPLPDSFRPLASVSGVNLARMSWTHIEIYSNGD